ncbi:MAG: hypothetical protein ABSE42_19790 [Bryobacteraceae bacterium]|jgi:hypothetical protein
MVVSIIIATFSSALLLYWFRYSCILILRNFSLDAQTTMAVDSQFTCRQVKELLRGATQLDGLERALERDYRLATYLIEHAAGLDLNSFEDRLLVLDYRVMQWYFRVTRSASPVRARRALSEMADVVGILAGRLDERAGLRSEA